MTEMYRVRFCGKTKIVISKTCEDNAYDGNAILWRTKGTSSTSYEAGEDLLASFLSLSDVSEVKMEVSL